MKSSTRQLLIVAICVPLGVCLTYFTFPRHGTIAYDCSIAEISPDFPPAIREECRKKNIQKGMWVPK